MEITREEANLLKILSERGGSLVVSGNVPEAAWDRLVANSYVTATATSGIRCFTNSPTQVELFSGWPHDTVVIAPVMSACAPMMRGSRA